MHYGIQKHHWTVRDVREFMQAGAAMQALFIASDNIRISAEEKELKKLKKK